MKLPLDKEKFISQWRYVEVARFVPSLDRVIRDKNGDDPIFYDIDEINSYRIKHNNIGLYTSVWHFNSTNLDDAIRLGSLYFDLDSEDINLCYEEAKILYNYLSLHIPEQSLIVYFTGKKGFHIECEAIALGINPSNELPKVFRYIASQLRDSLNVTSMDFSVYDMRRMWRLPGSVHQSTNLYKTLLPKDIFLSNISVIAEYAKTPKDFAILEQSFNFTSNEWYRQFTYQMEEEKNKPKDFLEHFNKFGSSGLKSFEQNQKIFQKEMLWLKCPSIKKLHQQAENLHFLEHEARLFLCSILSYSEESIGYLHEILSNCEDYNPGKSQAHINDWVRRREIGIGGRPYTCERANSVGVGCGDCSLEKKNKWVKVGDRFIETQEKSSPSPVRFAYRSSAKDETK
ncbi:hypothetical protein [Flavobacterium sp.]|uniref:hypothetical protein n=1 Tax=Flavobacterium sp. TaxID=239 RepID=UPI003BC235BF